MPLGRARWIHTHAIDRIDLVDIGGGAKGLRLHSGMERIDVPSDWGLEIAIGRTSDNRPTCVRLDVSVEADLANIVEWEKAFPDEPKIGTARKAA